MKKIDRSDYEELLHELMACFKFLLTSQLKMPMENLKFPDHEAHYTLLKDFRKKIFYGFHVLPLYEIAEKIKTCLIIFDSLSQKNHNQLYREALYLYVKEGYPIYGFDNKKLKNRINGLLNVRKRYEENLYKKREVLYRVLREEVAVKGKWNNLNSAVSDSYLKINYEFELFNREWVKNEMIKLQDKIKENEYALKVNRNKKYNEELINFQNRSFENVIHNCKKQYEKLEKSLKAKNVSDILGKKLAFHSDYQEESIINHLRNCPELLQEIIIGYTLDTNN
ncbi:hypothetical protein CDG60_03475 [Acinetobacter chinensis]|uniref:Uncharacterized protein n=2 Tax=Acinetobacter chinensis TaxID=2004650 RepID=A0A3B7M1T9_9GAMM|nr:hypothetical protein CDG60_03475 [Acinetobacter chinensis]